MAKSYLFGNDQKHLLDSVRLAVDNNSYNSAVLNFVEIGCAEGGTSSLVIDELSRLAVHYNYYGIDMVSIFPKPELKNNAFKFIRGISYSKEVLDQIPDSISWLFIDGCHCEICVLRDCIYTNRISKGGVVLFHDCSPLTQLKDRQDYTKLENYHDMDKAFQGINVLSALEKVNLLEKGFNLYRLAEPQIQGGINIYVKN